MFPSQICFDEDMLDRKIIDWLWALGYFSDTWGEGETFRDILIFGMSGACTSQPRRLETPYSENSVRKKGSTFFLRFWDKNTSHGGNVNSKSIYRTPD